MVAEVPVIIGAAPVQETNEDWEDDFCFDSDQDAKDNEDDVASDSSVWSQEEKLTIPMSDRAELMKYFSDKTDFIPSRRVSSHSDSLATSVESMDWQLALARERGGNVDVAEISVQKGEMLLKFGKKKEAKDFLEGALKGLRKEIERDNQRSENRTKIGRLIVRTCIGLTKVDSGEEVAILKEAIAVAERLSETQIDGLFELYVLLASFTANYAERGGLLVKCVRHNLIENAGNLAVGQFCQQTALLGLDCKDIELTSAAIPLAERYLAASKFCEDEKRKIVDMKRRLNRQKEHVDDDWVISSSESEGEGERWDRIPLFTFQKRKAKKDYLRGNSVLSRYRFDSSSGFTTVRYPKPSCLFSLKFPSGRRIEGEVNHERWLKELILKHTQSFDTRPPPRDSLSMQLRYVDIFTSSWGQAYFSFIVQADAASQRRLVYQVTFDFFSQLERIPVPDWNDNDEIEDRLVLFEITYSLLRMTAETFSTGQMKKYSALIKAAHRILMNDTTDVILEILEASMLAHHASRLNRVLQRKALSKLFDAVRKAGAVCASGETHDVVYKNRFSDPVFACGDALCVLQLLVDRVSPLTFDVLEESLFDLLDQGDSSSSDNDNPDLFSGDVNDQLICDAETRIRVMQECYKSLPVCELKARICFALGKFFVTEGNQDQAESIFFEGLYILDRSIRQLVEKQRPAALSSLSGSLLIAYADTMLLNDKYRYAVVAYESCMLLYRITERHNDYSFLVRRLAPICTQQRDMERSIKYYAMILQECHDSAKTNEAVYTAEIMASIFEGCGELSTAEQYLTMGIKILPSKSRSTSEVRSFTRNRSNASQSDESDEKRSGSSAYGTSPNLTPRGREVRRASRTGLGDGSYEGLMLSPPLQVIRTDSSMFISLNLKLANIYLQGLDPDRGIELLRELSGLELPFERKSKVLYRLTEAYLDREWLSDAADVLCQVERHVRKILTISRSGSLSVRGLHDHHRSSSSVSSDSHIRSVTDPLIHEFGSSPPVTPRGPLRAYGLIRGNSQDLGITDMKKFASLCARYYRTQGRFAEALTFVDFQLSVTSNTLHAQMGKLYLEKGKIISRLLLDNIPVTYPTGLRVEWDKNDVGLVLIDQNNATSVSLPSSAAVISLALKFYFQSKSIYQHLGDEIKVAQIVNQIGRLCLRRMFDFIALLNYPSGKIDKLFVDVDDLYSQCTTFACSDFLPQFDMSPSTVIQDISPPTVLTVDFLAANVSEALETVSFSLCCPLLHAELMISLSQIAFLADKEVLSYSYFEASYDIVKSMYLIGTTVAIGTACSLRYLRKIYNLLIRIAKSLFAFHMGKNLLDNNLQLLDTVIWCEHELLRKSHRCQTGNVKDWNDAEFILSLGPMCHVPPIVNKASYRRYPIGSVIQAKARRKHSSSGMKETGRRSSHLAVTHTSSSLLTEDEVNSKINRSSLSHKRFSNGTYASNVNTFPLSLAQSRSRTSITELFSSELSSSPEKPPTSEPSKLLSNSMFELPPTDDQFILKGHDLLPGQRIYANLCAMKRSCAKYRDGSLTASELPELVSSLKENIIYTLTRERSAHGSYLKKQLDLTSAMSVAVGSKNFCASVYNDLLEYVEREQQPFVILILLDDIIVSYCPKTGLRKVQKVNGSFDPLFEIKERKTSAISLNTSMRKRSSTRSASASSADIPEILIEKVNEALPSSHHSPLADSRQSDDIFDPFDTRDTSLQPQKGSAVSSTKTSRRGSFHYIRPVGRCIPSIRFGDPQVSYLQSLLVSSGFDPLQSDDMYQSVNGFPGFHSVLSATPAPLPVRLANSGENLIAATQSMRSLFRRGTSRNKAGFLFSIWRSIVHRRKAEDPFSHTDAVRHTPVVIICSHALSTFPFELSSDHLVTRYCLLASLLSGLSRYEFVEQHTSSPIVFTNDSFSKRKLTLATEQRKRSVVSECIVGLRLASPPPYRPRILSLESQAYPSFPAIPFHTTIVKTGGRKKKFKLVHFYDGSSSFGHDADRIFSFVGSQVPPNCIPLIVVSFTDYAYFPDVMHAVLSVHTDWTILVVPANSQKVIVKFISKSISYVQRKMTGQTEPESAIDDTDDMLADTDLSRPLRSLEDTNYFLISILTTIHHCLRVPAFLLNPPLSKNGISIPLRND